MKQVVAALIVREDGKILICQRTKSQPLALKWEFPGGKIEPGEQPREALRRELQEELGIEAHIGEKIAQVAHTYKNGNAVELHFFVVVKFQGSLQNRIFKDIRWASRKDLPGYDFLDADLDLVKKIAAGEVLTSND